MKAAKAKGQREVASLREEVAQLRQALQDREEQLAVLHRITQNVTSSLDIDTLLQKIFVEIKKIIPFDMMVILLLDETGENLRLFTLRKEREMTRLEKGYLIPKGNTASGWVVDHNRPRIAKDLSQIPEPLLDEELGLLEGMRSYLMLPLVSKAKPIGTLDIAACQPEVYHEAQAELMQQLAGQIAVAIENAQLYGQLRENKLFLENLIESSIDAIVATNREGIITFASRGVERLIGYRPEELLGRSSSQFYATGEVGVKILRELGQGKRIQDYETEVVTKDGRSVWVSLSASLLYNEKGEVVGTLRIAKDISRRKRLEEQIMQSERMAAAGKLAAGIAHEINNPIAIILSRIDCLQAEASRKGLPTAGLLEDLEVIQHHAQSISRITNTLLTFTRESFKPRDSFLKFRACDINGLMGKTLLLFRHSLQQKGLRLKYEPDPSHPQIWGDDNTLQKVFLNLLQNALDDTPPGGCIALRVRQRPRMPGWVRIQVSDTGTGIPPENLSRIFDLFFTTKEVGKGTGLGLSICHEIIKNHGGTIDVRSQWGKGSTFIVTLPAPPLTEVAAPTP
ncbi:MAG: PAS domain S-box protein [Candidatus Tectomicrobia bacterium]|uniref:histidine kinase n=1 Tax=Tectimicrobiota bacterium TaxID=2528274 RepID=A0A932CPN9_UNCTE|nr:PAS domain S-box protein [Candidatus Tectomicrobia bacterium]